MTASSASDLRSLIGVKRLSSSLTLATLCSKVLRAIDNRKYVGEYPWRLYSAAYGIIHGIQTGRIDTSRAIVLEKLSGKGAASFFLSIVEKELTGDDVSRFCNGRAFRHNGLQWVAVSEENLPGWQYSQPYSSVGEIMTDSSFESVRSIVMDKLGYDSYVDQVNLCLSIARDKGICDLMDHIAVGLDYLHIEDKIIWTEAIMDAQRAGVVSIE